MKSIIASVTLFLCQSYLFAQNEDVGLLLNNGNISDGYILFTPEKNKSVYLINNCGEKINEWTFSERPGLTCYLLENGNLLQSGKDSLEIRDWNNNLIWSYDLDGNGINHHHDIEPLPNGNILCIVRDEYTVAQTTAAGKDPILAIGDTEYEKIIEIEPVGTNSANIVWEWKFFDHLVQEFDNSKPNYGVVSNNPQLLNINIDSDVDYIHFNGIDYNEDLDQILLSARHTNEIYIIDHSTTTTEAASHSGGNSGKGGDILWRWGNIAAYNQGSVSDQKLGLQHDAKWTKFAGDAGKISVFSNEAQTPQVNGSEILLIEPNLTNYNYNLSNGIFDPINEDWKWSGNVLGNEVAESKKSGVIQLENGNFLLTETSLGQASEVTKDGDVIWVYRNPAGVNIYNQGTFLAIGNNNTTFRMEKYPSNYAGFAGKDMTPDGIIEDYNTNSDTCAMGLNIIENIETSIQLVNPAVNGKIHFINEDNINFVNVYDVNGKVIESNHPNLIALNKGIYFIEFYLNGSKFVKKLIVQ